MCKPGQPCYTEQDTLRWEQAELAKLDPIMLTGERLEAIVAAQHKYDAARLDTMKQMDGFRQQNDVLGAIGLHDKAKRDVDEYHNAVSAALADTALAGLTVGEFTIDLSWAEQFKVGFALRTPKDDRDEVGQKLGAIIQKALEEAAGELGIGNIKVEEVRL